MSTTPLTVPDPVPQPLTALDVLRDMERRLLTGLLEQQRVNVEARQHARTCLRAGEEKEAAAFDEEAACATGQVLALGRLLGDVRAMIQEQPAESTDELDRLRRFHASICLAARMPEKATDEEVIHFVGNVGAAIGMQRAVNADLRRRLDEAQGKKSSGAGG